METRESYELAALTYDQRREIEFDLYRRLLEALALLGIPSDQYVVGGASSDGALSIEHDSGLWVVFVGERAQRSNPAFFSDPCAAANFFIWELMRSNRQMFPDLPSIPFRI